MVFHVEEKQSIAKIWEEITSAQQGCINSWQDNWQPPLEVLTETYVKAIECDTPYGWSKLNLSLRALRKVMSQGEGEETILYVKLIKLTDVVEQALDRAATPDNVIPRGELRELIELIDEQWALIAEERRHTSIWQQDQRRRLDQIEEQIKAGKRTIVHLEGVSLVSVGIDELISAIKDCIVAIKNGVDLLNDERFTQQIRQGAQRLWGAATRFVQATKDRFAAFRLPWRGNAAAQTDSTLGLQIVSGGSDHPAAVSFLVRTGSYDRERSSIPGAGEPFWDSWEDRGRKVNGPKLVVVPAGEFDMGSPTEEGDVDERPQHRVAIPKPFAIGIYPLTFAEWELCVAAGGIGHNPKTEWGRGNYPVTRISYQDALAYLNWLSTVTEKDYRLPSEAEWEYAARAGAQSRYSFGTDELSLTSYGWYEGNCGGKAHPVGKKKPNTWGIYDLHGNVWEWCRDAWHDCYVSKPQSIRTNGGSWDGDGSLRVLRGGSWYHDANRARSANRGKGEVNSRHIDYGFRVCRTL
jgi:formylglycine-generating enzyme required for sulfatase activity